jgi:DNA modification methylase
VIHHGDCLEVLRTLPDNSVDAVVTDPPYGLSFMGKRWDYDVPSVEVWAECLRVLKPGGHLLAFAGTRTQHRMAVRIEDAGFEIRDMIAWVYGSGFPKSLDVSKALDKINAEAGRLHKFTEWMRSTGVTAKRINAATGTFMASHYLTAGSQPAIPTPDLWAIIRPMCGDVPAWVDELVARIAAEREVVGVQTRYNEPSGIVSAGRDERTLIERKLTSPATDAARQWQGWGTALKPALEPITVARKPLIGTVAENVLAHGTGALNVDGCRVEGQKPATTRGCGERDGWGMQAQGRIEDNGKGRCPANLIHDGSDEVVGLFPQSTDGIAVGGMGRSASIYGTATGGDRGADHGYGGKGSAARFFYCAKASKADREKNNHHPTVKPTALMQYLCRLVTPPGGTVLDPFMGSGSTGAAAMLEGFQFIGIEREAEYVAIARERIESRKDLFSV